MFAVSVFELSRPSENVASSVSGFTVFSIWLAIGFLALVLGAIAVRVSTQRLKRIDALLSDEDASTTAGSATYSEVSAAA
jgi:hypothetical protein